MITVTLPDASRREYEAGVTVADVAQSIGAGLAKAALCGKVDGKLVDLSYKLEKDASVAIVTAKDPEGLELLRHSTAHLMAQAVKELYPTAEVTIGPPLKTAFTTTLSTNVPLRPKTSPRLKRACMNSRKRIFRSNVS